MRARVMLGLLAVMGAIGVAVPAAAEPRRSAGAQVEAEGHEQTTPDPPTELTAPPMLAPPKAPAVGAVLVAAYAAAGLDRAPGRGWTRRARLAGLIPLVTLRTTRDTSWQDRQPDVGHGATIEARATWRLDRLLFESRELQVAAIEAARRRERRQLASRVIRAYFDWRRSVEAAPGGDDRGSTRTAEAIAELDALTEGWFSDQLADGRPSAGRRGAGR